MNVINRSEDIMVMASVKSNFIFSGSSSFTSERSNAVERKTRGDVPPPAESVDCGG